MMGSGWIAFADISMPFTGSQVTSIVKMISVRLCNIMDSQWFSRQLSRHSVIGPLWATFILITVTTWHLLEDHCKTATISAREPWIQEICYNGRHLFILHGFIHFCRWFVKDESALKTPWHHYTNYLFMIIQSWYIHGSSSSTIIHRNYCQGAWSALTVLYAVSC